MANIRVTFTTSWCAANGDYVENVQHYERSLVDTDWGTWKLDEAGDDGLASLVDLLIEHMELELIDWETKLRAINPVDTVYDGICASLLQAGEPPGELPFLTRAKLKERLSTEVLRSLLRGKGRPCGSGKQKEDEAVLVRLFGEVDERYYPSVNAALLSYIKQRKFEYTGTQESALSRVYKHPFYIAEMQRRRANLANAT
jgi:hypothetical protein